MKQEIRWAATTYSQIHTYSFIPHFMFPTKGMQEIGNGGQLLIHTYSFTASAAVTLPISLSYFKEQHKT